MKKAFTLIELLVAVGILAMILAFASLIFRFSIDSHRTASANAEIMRKLRAITDQLNTDFQGFIKDPYPVVAFETTSDDPNGIRSDRIIFFANGDFQSTRQYLYVKPVGSDGLKTIYGDAARIYYGQSSKPDPKTNNPQDCRKVILARKMQILTDDDTLYDTDPNDPNDPNEYTKRSLSEWNLIEPPTDDNDLSIWIGRPNVQIDSNDPNRTQEIIPMFMAEGVHNFKIELLEDVNDGSLVWWPSNQQVSEQDDYDGTTGFPPAMKFTFTLYDSKGVIKSGRTFTHIVYLDTD
jgi:prepilin-type N-terminal cleavage/methylation domain-containing protein